MKSRWIITAVQVLTVSLILMGRADAEMLTHLVKRIQPAVATVITYDANRQMTGFGSGFFVDSKGSLVTNYHVLEGAYFAEVRTKSGNTYPVRSVLAENAASDLVRVSIELPEKELAWLDIAGEVPSIAEKIVVVGSPLGLEQTVTEGIVSAIREVSPAGAFFQISAPISRGSSGGPVVNMDGEVVGIVTFMMVMGQNLNFAVSSRGIRELPVREQPIALAEWTYEKSLAKPDLAGKLCRQGLAFSTHGDYDRALDFFRKATENNPANTTAWYGLGSCYDGLEQPENVLETYRQAIRINSDDAALRLELGSYLVKLERYEEAGAVLKNAVAIDPHSVDAFSGLALVQTKLGQYDDAMESHRQVIRLTPDSSAAYYNMGVTLKKQARLEEALEAFQTAVTIDPENLYARYHIGLLFSTSGQTASAIDAHKESIRIDPDFAPAHYQIGMAYVRSGDRAFALEEYKILKRLDPRMADELFSEIYK